MSEARVLHVLPHPGGGGETYVSRLERLPGYSLERLHLTPGGRVAETPAGLARLARALPPYDLVHVHGDSTAIASWALVGRRPTVITLHGCHLLGRSSGRRAALLRAALRRVFSRASAVIAVSESELEFAAGIAPGSDRLVLVRNGVPVPEPTDEAERSAARERLGLDPAATAVLFAGELIERKQPLQFAQAVRAARTADPALVGLIAGEGPLASQLRLLEGEGLRLLGQRQDVPDLLAAGDVFVLPSLREGLSYALLEAMAQGKPTLVSDAPGNPDAVGDAGLVVRAGDVEGLAESLTRLAAEPELRAELGRAARARVRDRFSLESMLEGTARVYERALDGGR